MQIRFGKGKILFESCQFFMEYIQLLFDNKIRKSVKWNCFEVLRIKGLLGKI